MKGNKKLSSSKMELNDDKLNLNTKQFKNKTKDD